MSDFLNANNFYIIYSDYCSPPRLLPEPLHFSHTFKSTPFLIFLIREKESKKGNKEKKKKESNGKIKITAQEKKKKK